VMTARMTPYSAIVWPSSLRHASGLRMVLSSAEARNSAIPPRSETGIT
jgi:hypothetical protein